MSLVSHLLIKQQFIIFFFLIEYTISFCQLNKLKDLTGFRNSKWGSTVNEVKSSEHEYYLQSFSGFGIYSLSYTSRFAGLKTRIDYTFKNGKLVEGTYTFKPNGDAKSDFKLLQSNLISDYGEPTIKVKPYIDYDSIWVEVTKYGRYRGPELYWKFNNGFIALIASKFEEDITLVILFSNSKSIEEYNRDREVSTENVF